MYHQPGDASPSFAQTGAEFHLDDSDSVFSYLDEDAIDIQSEIGGSETYELPSRDRSPSIGRNGRRIPSGLRHRPSASTMASFQLYTPDEEMAVRRKFDRKLVLFVALLFLLSFLDRSSTFPLLH